MTSLAGITPTLVLILIGVVTPLMHLIVEILRNPSGLSEFIISPWIRDALFFTIWQAGLSSFLSVAGALPVALLLANRQWPGRRALLTLSSLPFALPSVLVAFAFVLAYGRSGLLRTLLPIETDLLYNPFAIIAAHIFFNLPFALRHLLDAIESIPLEQHRGATILRLTFVTRWRVMIWPHIRGTVATLLLLITILCLSSFAVVLILGGGPQTTTLEVAIYQLLRFDANPTGAALLALGQIALLTPAVLLYRRLAKNRITRGAINRSAVRFTRFSETSPTLRLLGSALIALYAIYLLLPLLGLAVDATRDFRRAAETLATLATMKAIANSLALAIPSSSLCLLASWLFVRAIAPLAKTSPKLASVISDSIWFLMGLSPAVLTLAWIVLLSAGDFDPYNHPYIPILLIHTLLALPLCIRLLLPHGERFHSSLSRSAQSIGLVGFRRMRLVEFPEMRRPLLSAFLIAFAFSFGDVSAVLMFGGGTFTTLPMHIFELMGAYRFGAAALASVLLAVICAGFFHLSESNVNQQERIRDL